MIKTLIAMNDDEGRRLDRILRKALPDLALSAIHRLMRKGLIKVNNKKAAPELLIKKGDEISVNLKEYSEGKSRLEASDRLLTLGETKERAKFKLPDILYDQKGIIAFNKAKGLVVHGKGENLNDIVLTYLKDKIPSSLSFKPGPLHRLDKESSGVIVFSKDLIGAQEFSRLLQERKIKKNYLAITEGELKKSMLWENEIIKVDKSEKNKTAISRVKPLATQNGHSLLYIEIETGRTHQIRAQAAFYGYPLLGDKMYGRNNKDGFFLHAWKMEIPQVAIIEAPIPVLFKDKLKELFGEQYDL